MSEYDRPEPYDAYDYQQSTTRPDLAHLPHAGLPTHSSYAGEYGVPHAPVPSDLPHPSTSLAMMSAAQPYSFHDEASYGQPAAQYPAYFDASPRRAPQIHSYTPHQGQTGTKVTVYFRSAYDLSEPRITALVMFGHRRAESRLMKTGQHSHGFEYALAASVPTLLSTGSSSAQVPLHLILDDSIVDWEPPSIEFGQFTYLDTSGPYPLDSPQLPRHHQLEVPRKRKLSPHSSPRRSPTKKPSLMTLGKTAAQASGDPNSPFRRPSLPETYLQGRKYSGTSDYQQTYGWNLPSTQLQQYVPQMAPSTTSLQPSHGQTWSYSPSAPSVARSPSIVPASRTASSQILPSPGAGHHPPLIRTSTIHSPVTPGSALAHTPSFNPYAMYPSNTKAMLKIDGDLNAMADTDKWTDVEWEAKRRLVQFQRNQSGSVITAGFEPVTLEDRIPNGICVSCIWWEEKRECYVTSVDTIALLESLVSVRFTVEEKNRIRRNLEGFRPATVSKTKADSDEFFKLIMGFPNPKPRNIEKDVKVFPWPILATALKKIIGKYASHPLSHRHMPTTRRAHGWLTVQQSASYSSTAAALHPPGLSYSARQVSDAVFEPRPGASPHSSSSATSHGQAFASTLAPDAYSPHPGGPAGLPMALPGGAADLRITIPTTTAVPTTSWFQPSAGYASDPIASTRAWELGSYLSSSPATGLPGNIPAYPYQPRTAPLAGPGTMPAETRFVPLHDYDARTMPTSTS